MSTCKFWVVSWLMIVRQQPKEETKAFKELCMRAWEMQTRSTAHQRVLWTLFLPSTQHRRSSRSRSIAMELQKHVYWRPLSERMHARCCEISLKKTSFTAAASTFHPTQFQNKLASSWVSMRFWDVWLELINNVQWTNQYFQTFECF